MEDAMKKLIATLCIATLPLSLHGAPAWGQTTSGETVTQTNGELPEETSQGEPAATRKPKNIKEWLSTNRTRKSSAIGAVAGAILGGLFAKARGQNVLRGAAAGAALGGVAGYLVGQHRDRVFAGRDEAVRRAQYDPSQGYVIRIESVQFEPKSIGPGGKVTLHVRYLVVGPDPHETIKINSYRGIKYQDSYLTGDQASLEVPSGGGIVESTAEFTLSKDAPAGTYAAEAILEDAQGRFNKTGTSPLYIAS
jgi:outer membrane lipoprotein SlyB